jgi:hypothetical protein
LLFGLIWPSFIMKIVGELLFPTRVIHLGRYGWSGLYAMSVITTRIYGWSELYVMSVMTTRVIWLLGLYGWSGKYVWSGMIKILSIY